MNTQRFSALIRQRVLALWLIGLTAIGSMTGAHAQPGDSAPPVDLRAALQDAVGNGTASTPAVVEGCSGCCSSHGGISNACAGNGRIYCNDGSVSPSCSCSSCGVSTPPPPPNCSGGQIWNGSACVCPSGEIYSNGTCMFPTQTCTDGQILSGGFCVCPPGQALSNGQCRATTGNFAIVPGLSGSWYEPDQSGHGFMIEVLSSPAGSLLATWFTFDNAGNAAWIEGVGQIAGNRVSIPAMVVRGGRFPPRFDASAIEHSLWGTLTFVFSDCSHATVDWTSSDPGFTALGTMHLEPLTRVAGTRCP